MYIHTFISETRRRQALDQPPVEIIGLDSVVNVPVLFQPYAETVRFSDYKRSGGEEVRYYHLLSYDAGMTLSISPSGSSRLVSGLYENRTITETRAASSCDILKNKFNDPNILQRFMRYQFVDIVLTLGRGRIRSRINCIELFNARLQISSSLRIPYACISQSLARHKFDLSSVIHDHLQTTDAPRFTPMNIPIVDAAVVIQLHTNSEHSQARIELPGIASADLNINTIAFF